MSDHELLLLASGTLLVIGIVRVMISAGSPWLRIASTLLMSLVGIAMVWSILGGALR